MVNLIEEFGASVEPPSSFPHDITVRAVRIPLGQGGELAARVWMPVDAEHEPVPAIIEYIPYRQRDYTALRDSLVHPWFAGHGYAALRVDLRGSGDSLGIPMDEYVDLEHDDALALLAWVTEQSWCNGSTGMMGISWGGFNALQIAARRPASLKAIVTVCSTDDRYTDDVHYLGGCMLSDNFTWGSLLLANMGRPPDPLMVGEAWRDIWHQRLAQAPLALVEWLSHPHRDGYWKHGSVCEDYADIECPVYAVGGWADSYTNAIPRLLNHLKSPCRALIGPWGHAYPHLGTPGPRVGFLQEATRWWDRWLKGIDNGIDREPKLHLWVQEGVAPAPSYEHRAGFWATAEQWPPEKTQEQIYPLNPHGLGGRAEKSARLHVSSPTNLGATAGEWMPLGVGAEMPLDQRMDDGGSLTFDSLPLDESLTICGSPVLHLQITSSTPVAQVVIRLNDVFPDGAATRMTYGALNLTHRNGHERPEALEPGISYQVSVSLNVMAQTIPRGHRLRLAISTGCWPMLWPAPEPTTLGIDTETSALVLPVNSDLQERITTLPPAAMPPPAPVRWKRPVDHQRRIVREVGAGITRVIHSRDEGAFQIDEHGMEVDARGCEQHWISDADPCSAGSRVDWRLSLARGEWSTAVECELELSSTADAFLLSTRLTAFEGRHRVFVRSSQHHVPRKLL